MNINLLLQCKYCDDVIHVRIGFANQEKQTFRFACQKCTSPIVITLDVDFQRISFKYAIEGGTELSAGSPDAFERSNQFVDLHLDYPTYYGDYEAGNTPFMRAVQELKGNLLPYEAVLEVLQAAVRDKQDIQAIIRFYLTENYPAFEKTVRRYLKKEDFPCGKQIDINRVRGQSSDFSIASSGEADLFAAPGPGRG